MTAEALEQELARSNGCNLALRLDHYASIDPDSAEARALVDQWDKDGHLPKTIAWRTASGAIRRLFKAPPGLQRMEVRSIKLDLRHGAGFCDVIPPSFILDKAKGLRGNYEWLPEQDPESIEAADLPAYVLDFFKEHSSALAFKNSSISTFCKNDASIAHLEDGHRDQGLFVIALSLFKGGMSYAEVNYIISHLAASCQPTPFPQKDAEIKIESAYKRYIRAERNITDEVREWVMTSSGLFMTSDVHKELELASRDLKKQANEACRRLEEKGLLAKCGRKRGCYRLIEAESPIIDFMNADISQVYDLRFPFNLQQYVNIYPKNVIVVAGASNAGKTAFMLNLVRMNMDRHKIEYFSSEMGPEEMKLRLLKFDDLRLKDWKFHPRERSSNFADAIVPDSINIIDYLEVNKDFYEVGGEIKGIFDRLNKGLAIIAIQKKTGVDTGRGGEFTLEKPRLYLAMDSGTIKIVKGKNWANNEINPNGLLWKFKLVGGAKFIETGGSLYDL